MDHPFPIPEEVARKIRICSMRAPLGGYEEIVDWILEYTRQTEGVEMVERGFDTTITLARLLGALFKTLKEVTGNYWEPGGDSDLSRALLAHQRALTYELMRQMNLWIWIHNAYPYDPIVRRDVLKAMEEFRPEPEPSPEPGSPQDTEPNDSVS